MVFKKLGILAAACIAANTYALPPTDAPDIEIFMSGASAQDNNIETLFNQLCVSGTLDIFRDNSNPARPGREHRAFFCNLDSSQVPGLSLTNPAVLFHKRSAGGSALGVNPIVENTAIDALAINNGNCARVGTTNEWLCAINNAGDLIQRVSTAGVSDVNPELFFSINTPQGFNPVNHNTVRNTIDVTSAAALVFGIPVTTSLRDALQEVQINAGRLAAGCIGQNNEACMPSLSTNQISSLLWGSVNHWDQTRVPDSTGTLMPFTQALATVAPPGRRQVAICRRVPGSGTQAQANAKFLHRPCSGFALNPAVAANSTDTGAIHSNPTTGPIVIENSGSGDVALCLNDFNNGTNLSGNNPDLQSRWAIGVQSTENNASLTDNYRFIKVDGVAPTIRNAANGTYLDWVELTYQWQKPGQSNAPNANQLAILEAISTNAAGPTILGPLNQSQYTHPWGVAGYLALSTNGHRLSPDGAFDVNNPVTPYTHFPPGFQASSDCRVPIFDRFVTDTNGNRVFPL
ncbi:MAG: hypothetical protein ACRERU_22740 [Methylococcales bacterium]